MHVNNTNTQIIIYNYDGHLMLHLYASNVRRIPIVSPEEASNNNTIPYVIELNPETQSMVSPKQLSWDLEAKM